MSTDRMTRRNFVKYGAGFFAALSAFKLSSCATLTKKRIPVGLQLYSVRKECEKDLPRTIEAVAKMGYEGVEFAGYYNYSAQDLRSMLDHVGLKCCGTHTQLDTVMDDNLPATIEFNQILGNKNLIVPWLPEERRQTEEDWLELCKMFNDLAEKLKPHGMRIGYHNHNFEFQPIYDKIPWDIFAQNTSPDVILQLDTGNAASGGGDPVEYLKKYPGRTKTIHLKEYSATNPKAILGEGDLNWKEIFSICESSGGTEWYIIEEEKEAYPPLECVEYCLKNFKNMRG
jgi:sugar phosphate isomerase/epimerase